MKERAGLIARLDEGPLDVIGDVHGEFDALQSLLAHLGYAQDGSHPSGRRVVFVGDLCDRGPDSPAVLDLAMEWVEAGRAQCVLGNHELNVLRGAPKHGNGWFFDRDHDTHNGEFLGSKAATPEKREQWLAFFRRLPIALYRDDVRIVHACWDSKAVAALEHTPVEGGPHEISAHYDAAANKFLKDAGVEHRAALEIRAHRHSFKDRNAVLPMLTAYAEEATIKQNNNPLRVLTSALEEPADKPAWAGGKWRMTNRSRWWQHYQEAIPVLIGHYWRRDARATPADVTGDWDYPLEDYGPYEWMGPRRNVFCLDYAVGGRYVERARGGQPPFTCRLAAMRWPERELVFDDGEQIAAR